ncbi:MAG: synthase subunit [Gammaproteobacteria bacterium]|jgi:F-type H+-transporting ATPase subunit b|nr:synthase subunit [Gammaproteobacteria bacterium]
MDINATLIGQMITFAIFIVFTMKFVWPPLMKVLEERRKKIADGLAAAERGQHDLEVAHFKAKEIIREAKAQASVIIEQANQRAHHIEEQAKLDARHIADKIKQTATAEIEHEKIKMLDTLRNQVAEVAVAGAEKLIKRNIDKAANQDILAALASEI